MPLRRLGDCKAHVARAAADHTAAAADDQGSGGHQQAGGCPMAPARLSRECGHRMTVTAGSPADTQDPRRSRQVGGYARYVALILDGMDD